MKSPQILSYRSPHLRSQILISWQSENGPSPRVEYGINVVSAFLARDHHQWKCLGLDGSRARSEESRRSLTHSLAHNRWSECMAISLARLPPPVCLSLSHWRSAASAATLGTAGSAVRSVRSAAPFERENREMIRSLFGLQLRRKLGLADHRKFVRQSVMYCTKIGKIN